MVPPMNKLDEFSCRFKGLEKLRQSTKVFKLKADINDSIIQATICEDDREETAFSIQAVDGNDHLDEAVKILETNLKLFLRNSDSHYSRARIRELFKIGHKYYKIIKNTASMKVLRLRSKPWYVDVEVVFAFYDEDGKLLVIWAFGQSSGIYHFCVPE